MLSFSEPGKERGVGARRIFVPKCQYPHIFNLLLGIAVLQLSQSPVLGFPKRNIQVLLGGEQGFETLILIFFSTFNPTSIAAQCTNSQDSSVINASQLLCHHFGTQGFPGGSDGKVCLQCGRPGFDPWVGRIPWRREWQPTPVLLPGKFHGWRSLVGYSPWGHKESDTTE